MGIFRSTDPTTFDDVDGIVINESAPAPNVQGVAANIALLVGQAERGTQEIFPVGSIGEFQEKFGKSSFGMNMALKNKKFGRLKALRVIASDAEIASKTFTDGGGTPKDIITFSAKQGEGAYGNAIQVKIEAGTVSGKKYTIKDSKVGALDPQEIYDNVSYAQFASANPFAASKLVVAEVEANAASEPANTVGFVSLTGGDDGEIADTDYQAALANAEIEGVANVVFLDSYTSARNGYLKTHAGNTQDRMVICGGNETGGASAAVSAAVTAVATLRDSDGRVIYAFNDLESNIDGVLTLSPAAHWLASIISQLGPHIDPASVDSVAFTRGATSVRYNLSRAQYIQLKEAGICAFEIDSDIGIKPKSGIVTQIANSSKVTILRRRMADFLENSAAKYLKNWQNKTNSKANRMMVKGALLTFVRSLQNDGILPKREDITDGDVVLIDTESLNTSSSIAQGFFKILWKQRIFSSMRFIVLSAEIGEDVVVSSDAA